MKTTQFLSSHPSQNRALNGGVGKIPPTANLSDALAQLGFKFQTMHSRIRSMTGLPVWGPAFTVQCYPGATFAVEEALEKAAPGEVLVIDGAGDTHAVLMGGLMSRRARQRGLAGAVIDGAVRDVEELQTLSWPVFAVGSTPASGTHARLGSVATATSCGEVVVQPGDWIAGDRDGVVVIPARILGEVLECARQIEEREAQIASALDRGLSLAEAAAAFKTRLA